MEESVREENGITLIAVVITIIVLLILAGISIATLTGENGILSKAKTAETNYSEKSAKERLELVLLDLQADKRINKEYNDKEFIDKRLQENQMTVSGNIVIVDGWKFEIDRSVPKIGADLGKGEENQQIQMVASVKNAVDYTKATIKAEITYEEEITTIQINGEEVKIPEKKDNQYVLEKEVTKNGIYTIYVKDEKDGYKIITLEVTDISEDMDIYTPEDLVAFRNKVNQGATYEEKNIRIMNDLDLSSVCGEDKGSWEPISKYEEEKTNYFKGTFNGNYHTIKKLYINDDVNMRLAFFGQTASSAIIQNIIMENLYINGNYNLGNTAVGSIVGYNYGQIINCAIESGEIALNNNKSGTYTKCGGIAAYNVGSIENCKNKAKITGNAKSRELYFGGIVGSNVGTIENSYNVGTLNATCPDGLLLGGIVGFSYEVSSRIENCYNIGLISGTSGTRCKCIGGLAGVNGSDSNHPRGTVKNSYCTTETTYSYYYYNGSSRVSSISGRIAADMLKSYESELGEAFVKDTENKNNGYPILKWEMENKK